MTLYLSCPEVTLPSLLRFIEKFSSLSGYAINWDKSELLPLSDRADLEFLHKMSFKIVHNQIKSLGIIATRKYGDSNELQLGK